MRTYSFSYSYLLVLSACNYWLNILSMKRLTGVRSCYIVIPIYYLKCEVLVNFFDVKTGFLEVEFCWTLRSDIVELGEVACH